MRTVRMSPLVVAIVCAVVIVVGAVSYYAWSKTGGGTGNGGQVACTMEAMLCPDGSAVGRTGPNCEFAPCPSDGDGGGGCSGPGDSCPLGYTCIQECGPPVVREGDPAPGYYCELNAVAQEPRNCPICLALGTRIATPNGSVAVESLRAGDVVWSVDGKGMRVAVPVSRVSSTPVSHHRVVHLVLEDGRTADVSAQHPTADGRTLGDLRAGDRYDGSQIVSVELIPYRAAATYDLLPESATGFYWANGILLGSTLF